jgi:hypothetical protein
VVDRAFWQYLDLRLCVSNEVTCGLLHGRDGGRRWPDHLRIGCAHCIINHRVDLSWQHIHMASTWPGVFVNVSTCFADGFCYGFSAKVDISTGWIHACSPVGPKVIDIQQRAEDVTIKESKKVQCFDARVMEKKVDDAQDEEKEDEDQLKM